jgi:hypothetical protein
MAPSSLVRSSWISATTITSACSSRPWLIQR